MAWGYRNRLDPASRVQDGIVNRAGVAAGASVIGTGTGTVGSGVATGVGVSQPGGGSVGATIPASPQSTPIGELPRRVAAVVKGQLPAGTTVDVIEAGTVSFPPVTQPVADPENVLIYYDEDDQVFEVVMPDDGGPYAGQRGRIAVDFDEPAAPGSLSLRPTAGDGASDPTDTWFDSTTWDGAATTWSQARNGTGTSQTVDDPVTLASVSEAEVGWRYHPGGLPNPYWDVQRAALRFDASAITGPATSGRLKVHVEYTQGSGAEMLTTNIGLYVCTKSPSTDQWAEADFAAQADDDVPASDDVYTVTELEAGVDVTTFEFELNAAGLAHITASGFVCFLLRTEYDAQDSVPVGGDEDGSYAAFYLQDNGDPTGPLLEVEF